MSFMDLIFGEGKFEEPKVKPKKVVVEERPRIVEVRPGWGASGGLVRFNKKHLVELLGMPNLDGTMSTYVCGEMSCFLYPEGEIPPYRGTPIDLDGILGKKAVLCGVCGFEAEVGCRLCKKDFCTDCIRNHQIRCGI
jgi:hypothetical protein